MLMHQKVGKLLECNNGPIAISDILDISIEDALMWVKTYNTLKTRKAKAERRQKAKSARNEARFTTVAYAGAHKKSRRWFEKPEDEKTVSKRAYELHMSGADRDEIAETLGISSTTVRSYVARERDLIKNPKGFRKVRFAGSKR
ncbi:MAG: hypothetical protein GY749_22870 [Desulfobacteraceae bacterium]|nr:hypothetical protein [Desulfobacteraceae bacterium]